MAFRPNIVSVPCLDGDGNPVTIINSALYGRGSVWHPNISNVLCANGVGSEVLLVNAAMYGRSFTPQPFLSAGIQNPTIWGTFNFGPAYLNQFYQEQWFIENVTQPVFYTLQAGILPPGLTLTNIGSTAQGQLAGIPSAADEYTFTLRATSPDAYSDKTFLISVFPQTVWGTFFLGPGYVNKDYQEQWFLENVTQPVVFSLVSGTLPPGLDLFNIGATAQGQISGAPTTPGDYTFTVRAQTPGSYEDKVFQVSIFAYPPVWGDFDFSPATIGIDYEFEWYLENVTFPVTYSISGGNLPDGLTLESTDMESGGRISGTPTGLETANFTITATNSVGTADKEGTIVVHDSQGGSGGFIFGN